MKYTQYDSTESDEEIVALYKNGDLEIFKVLINRYTSPLYNFATRLTNKNDAGDIVQDVFIKVWKSMERFNPLKASFKTWIFTIARNTTTDFLRKKKSILFSDLNTSAEQGLDETFEENILAEDILPDEALQKLQDSEFLNKTLEKLHPNYQEVLVLHYQEELTFEEIGKVLHKPLNTVKSTHRRAIVELRKMLK
jgi:RNA polymerase sigma-70 factor, ECF subfamily